MLTDGRFWIGLIVGAVVYHFWMKRQAAKGGS